jgi:hypothetical protein
MGDSFSIADVIRGLHKAGFSDLAANVLEMQRHRVLGDILQTSAVLDQNFQVQSLLTDPNDYQGPGTGYRLEGERWKVLQDLPQAGDPKTFIQAWTTKTSGDWLEETGPAQKMSPGDRLEIVIAVDPAFGSVLNRTINGLDLKEVLAAVVSGAWQEGVASRVVRVCHTSDCAFIGHAGAKISGSGIAVGMQAKGTAVIHKHDLPPLENLELFPQAPNLSLENYQAIGRNAARYAKGEPAVPVPVKIDNTARLRLIVQNTLLHHKSTETIDPNRRPVELAVKGDL